MDSTADSSAPTAPAVQLASELLARLRPLAVLDALSTAEADAQRLAGSAAAGLADPDRRVATANLIYSALWPEGTTPGGDWWASPLGIDVASVLVYERPDDVGELALSYLQAGDILGLNPKSVGQAVRRGQLVRSGHGGVTLRSTLQRLQAVGRVLYDWDDLAATILDSGDPATDLLVAVSRSTVTWTDQRGVECPVIPLDEFGGPDGDGDDKPVLALRRRILPRSATPFFTIATPLRLGMFPELADAIRARLEP
jgi:hypothetical protein